MTPPSVILVTIRRDLTSPSYEAERQRAQFLMTPGIAEFSVPAGLDAQGDVVRARSNSVAMVLNEYPTAKYILWWDDDVIAPSMMAIEYMIKSGYDVVGLPVPRKKIERWGSEYEAVDFAYRCSGIDGETKRVEADARGCIEVDALPFGLMLTSLHSLRTLCERHYDELWYRDKGREAVAIFSLMLTDTKRDPKGHLFRELLSEDYSFCERWRATGGKVHMMLHPALHVGQHVFRGHLAGLKHAR